MTTILLGIIAFLVLAIVFMATGKKAPPRSIEALPTPSTAVRSLVNEKKLIEAIRLYRRDTGVSLYEAKQVIDHLRHSSAA